MFEDILEKKYSEEGYITMRFHKSVILDTLASHGRIGLQSVTDVVCEMLRNEIEHYAKTITEKDIIKRLQEIAYEIEQRKKGDNNV